MIRIAHARISEQGTKDGKAGDQTKHEVMITGWTNTKWTEIYRPKNDAHAEIIAQKAVDAANNDHIGYSQYSRYSLFNAVCNNGYDIRGLKQDVNCDCSSLVMTCCRAAGITVPKGMYTGSEDTDLMKTGAFMRFRTPSMLAGEGLRRGDILRKVGHTAIVVTGSDQAELFYKLDSAKSFDPSLAKKYLTTTTCYLRTGAGTTKQIITTLRVGTACYNFGYYTKDKRGVKWLYVVTGHLTGFISERVVTK